MTIVIQFTHDLPTVFLHFLLQSPLHQAQQVAVQQDLSSASTAATQSSQSERLMAASTITSSTRRIVFANPPVGINLQFNMQAVIFQQMQVGAAASLR
ncbi:hypothetical protein ACNKHU_18325 [Shigella flexneri]